MLTVYPAIVSLPSRCPSGFGATSTITTPGPAALAPDVIVRNGSPLTAVQVHVHSPVTARRTVSPLAPAWTAMVEMSYGHPNTTTVVVFPPTLTRPVR